MSERTAKDAIKKIAKREGKSESEIRQEMEKAIMIGFLNKGTRNMWDNLFGVGKLPSPEEFITVLSMNVGKRRSGIKRRIFKKQFDYSMW